MVEEGEGCECCGVEMWWVLGGTEDVGGVA